MPLTELWVHLGVGCNTGTRVIAVHDVVPVIGNQRCSALPVFHAFSGCDTICWKRKKSAWNAFPQVTDTFLQLLADADINDTVVSVLERFLIIMYDRTTDADDLNSARRHFFHQEIKVSGVAASYIRCYCAASDEQSSSQCTFGASH